MTVEIDRAGVAGIQELVRDLLRELDRVAGLAGVRWFLAYGTALGAIRDGDLIPWDVDADIWLPHDQHQRFLDECVPLLGPDYELLTPETHADYEYLFPRLTRRGIHHVLVRLDIFPLDPAPGRPLTGRLHLRALRLLAQAFFVKRARTDVRLHYSPAKRLLARSLRLLVLPVPGRTMLGLFRRLQHRHAGRGTGVLVNSCGSYGSRELFRSGWFAEAVPRSVGGALLPVPAAYDAVLTQVYGDYRTPVPPARQQEELEHATTTFVAPLREQGLLT
jgi:lipopolysaccharide cholinephosphotransferase